MSEKTIEHPNCRDMRWWNDNPDNEPYTEEEINNN